MMKPLVPAELFGTWAPVLLPINADDGIDWSRLEDELQYQCESGIQGVYTNGTSGEFWTLTMAEYERVSGMTAEVCERYSVGFQLGASHPCPHACLERIEVARQLSPGAVQVILADWLPVRMEDAISCLSRFAEAAAPVGLVLYNPGHAKRELSGDEVLRLKAEVPSLIGCKGSQWQVLCDHDGWDPESLAVFAGGRVMADAYARGIRGAYSEVACMHPVGAARWYELMSRDLDAAREIGTRITRWRTEYAVPLMERYGYAGPFNDKLFAAVGDWADIGTRMRWPYGGADPAHAVGIRAAARELVPEIFCPS